RCIYMTTSYSIRCSPRYSVIFLFFFFTDTPTSEIYTLSLHVALPIWLKFALSTSASACAACRAWILDRTRLSDPVIEPPPWDEGDRKSTRLNSSHRTISYAVFCLKKK